MKEFVGFKGNYKNVNRCKFYLAGLWFNMSRTREIIEVEKNEVKRITCLESCDLLMEFEENLTKGAGKDSVPLIWLRNEIKRRLNEEMSIDIFDGYGIKVTRFYGGNEQGICYQIMIEDKYIELTEREFCIFVRKIAFNNIISWSSMLLKSFE